MKQLISSFLFLSFTINVFADCTFSGIWMWPNNDSINANGIVIIEGYASDMEHVEKIAAKFPAYLQSANHKVPLHILDYNEGGMLLNQVILKPSKPLIVGENYQLVVEGLDVSKFYYTGKKKGEIKKWYAIPEADTMAPTFISYPIEMNKSLTHFGCGPAVYVNFGCEVADVSDCLVKTKLTNKLTGNSTTYVLHIRSGKISVGHGMCSGAFYLLPGAEYEVEFQLMNMAGSVGASFGPKITFIAPYE